MSHRSPDWDPELSGFADDELDPEARRRLEAALASDPERAELLKAWRHAMDLWRDDTDRQTAAIDLHALAARVLDDEDGVRVAEQGWTASAGRVRRYAAAAVLLMAFGIGGAAWLGPHPRQSTLLRSGAAIRMIEQDRIDHQGRYEMELQPMPGPTTGFDKER